MKSVLWFECLAITVTIVDSLTKANTFRHQGMRMMMMMMRMRMMFTLQ